MTPERWKQIKIIAQDALASSTKEREAFINNACQGDLELKKEINSLLHFHDEVGEFLEQPLIELSSIKTAPSVVRQLLSPGTLLQQRYLIMEQIGQGGMGAVYKAQDKRLNNVVALKQTIVTGDRLRKAFEQEAQLLAQLRHAALPVVIDHFYEPQGQFLVMEFIDGKTLSELLSKQKEPFKLSQILVWTKQLLEVLNYLHSQTPPVIHRDIKPNNLKLNERDQIILLDFGLAKGLKHLSSTNVDNSSVAGYTPHFAPLEQINGSGTDYRTDIYSLAATLYNLITGHKPPDATFRAAAMLNGEPDPLKAAHLINSEVDPNFAQLLCECLSPNINLRPKSARAMLAKLESLQLYDSKTITTQIKHTFNQSNSQTRGLEKSIETINLPKNISPKLVSKLSNRKVFYSAFSLLMLLILFFSFNAIPTLTSIANNTNKLEDSQLLAKTANNTPNSKKPTPLPEDAKQGLNFGKPGFKANPISVDIADVSLYDLLRFISDNYGLNYAVDESVPKMKVSMKVNDVPWDKALISVLEANNLGYKVEDTILCIFLKSNRNLEKDSERKNSKSKNKLKN
ncbi:MAG: protein kinase [Blastocatellia bacterium]